MEDAWDHTHRSASPDELDVGGALDTLHKDIQALASRFRVGAGVSSVTPQRLQRPACQAPGGQQSATEHWTTEPLCTGLQRLDGSSSTPSHSRRQKDAAVDSGDLSRHGPAADEAGNSTSSPAFISQAALASATRGLDRGDGAAQAGQRACLPHARQAALPRMRLGDLTRSLHRTGQPSSPSAAPGRRRDRAGGPACPRPQQGRRHVAPVSPDALARASSTCTSSLYAAATLLQVQELLGAMATNALRGACESTGVDKHTLVSLRVPVWWLLRHAALCPCAAWLGMVPPAGSPQPSAAPASLPQALQPASPFCVSFAADGVRFAARAPPSSADVAVAKQWMAAHDGDEAVASAQRLASLQQKMRGEVSAAAAWELQRPDLVARLPAPLQANAKQCVLPLWNAVGMSFAARKRWLAGLHDAAALSSTPGPSSAVPQQSATLRRHVAAQRAAHGAQAAAVAPSTGQLSTLLPAAPDAAASIFWPDPPSPAAPTALALFHRREQCRVRALGAQLVLTAVLASKVRTKSNRSRPAPRTQAPAQAVPGLQAAPQQPPRAPTEEALLHALRRLHSAAVEGARRAQAALSKCPALQGEVAGLSLQEWAAWEALLPEWRAEVQGARWATRAL